MKTNGNQTNGNMKTLITLITACSLAFVVGARAQQDDQQQQEKKKQQHQHAHAQPHDEQEASMPRQRKPEKVITRSRPRRRRPAERIPKLKPLKRRKLAKLPLLPHKRSPHKERSLTLKLSRPEMPTSGLRQSLSRFRRLPLAKLTVLPMQSIGRARSM